MIESALFRKLATAVMVVLLICGCFAIIALIMYVVAKGWNETTLWGAFGDFVGGLFNPIFAFANLIVLVVISYQIVKIEEDRAERDRVQQRQFTLYPLRQAALSDFTNLFSDLFQKAVYIPKESLEITRAVEFRRLDFRHFIITHRHLFPSLKEYNSSDMDEEFKTLKNAMITFKAGEQAKWVGKERKAEVKKMSDALNAISRKQAALTEKMISDFTKDAAIEIDSQKLPKDNNDNKNSSSGKPSPDIDNNQPADGEDKKQSDSSK